MEYALNNEGTESITNILHKYYRIDQRFINLLVNNEMWFSNPDDFNDPYDSYLVVDSNNTYEEILNHLKDLTIKYELRLSDKEIKEKARFWYDNPSALAEYLKENREKEKEKKGIVCFSRSDNILLMWSHYADSHKGACLTFDISKDHNFFSLPFLVDYPSLNFIKERNTRVRYKHIIATKSIDWKYEEEVRIVRDIRDHGNSRGNIKFNKSALIEIKFGLRTNPKDIETIKEIKNGLGYKHVKLFKAELKKSEFGIHFNEIT
jgi:hypothetical protein